MSGIPSGVNGTRWPDKETVSDCTQGAQLAKVQELVDDWATGYDWRKLEAKLNALPQFITEIDGLDIHFIHVRSPHANALKNGEPAPAGLSAEEKIAYEGSNNFAARGSGFRAIMGTRHV